MDKLTQKIKTLNEIYISMKRNYETLKKMFKTGSNIHQKIILSEEILAQVYIGILDDMESDEINKKFNEIIKNERKRNNEK